MREFTPHGIPDVCRLRQQQASSPNGGALVSSAPPAGARSGFGIFMFNPRKLTVGLVATLAVVPLLLAACGPSSPTPSVPATVDAAVQAALAAQATPAPTQMPLPPNVLGQIGLTRTWIPKAIDRLSVEALVYRVTSRLGFHDPSVGEVGQTAFINDGVSYQRWRFSTGTISGSCNLLRVFANELESQSSWPTLVVDGLGTFNIKDGPPTTVEVTFYITVRESDSPPETEAEYRALIADRGTAATGFSCIPLPTPDAETRARRAEFHDVRVGVLALMVENALSSIPTPVSANTAPCTTGTQDMGAYPDSGSVPASAQKTNNPGGNAYTDGVDPLGDKDGFLLFGHDITADNAQTALVKYIDFNNTTYCYTIDSNGTVHQFLVDGTEVVD